MRRFSAALLAVLAFTFPLSAAHAAGVKVPAVGQVAPGFTLRSQDGTQVSLASFRGKWVVLYFYPRDMTPGCTLEAHNFQRDLAQYTAKNAVILGVSVDSVDSHKQFCTQESLTFRLLSDASTQVTQAYGSLSSVNGTPIANRNTFLIDPAGNVAQRWTGVVVEGHSGQVLAALPTPIKPAMGSANLGIRGNTTPVKPPVVTDTLGARNAPSSVKPPVVTNSQRLRGSTAPVKPPVVTNSQPAATMTGPNAVPVKPPVVNQ